MVGLRSTRRIEVAWGDRWHAIFPRNRRGGVLFRFYTGSALNFVSFCCNPFPFSSSTARIARSRRGEAIRGVGPLNGAGVKIRILFLSKEIAPKGTETMLRRTLDHALPCSREPRLGLMDR